MTLKRASWPTPPLSAKNWCSGYVLVVVVVVAEVVILVDLVVVVVISWWYGGGGTGFVDDFQNKSYVKEEDMR